MEDHEPRVSGWVQSHTEVVWGALCVIFAIYGANALVHVQHGQLGVDAFNVIGIFGGALAAVAAGIIATVTVRRKRKSRRSPEDR